MRIEKEEVVVAGGLRWLVLRHAYGSGRDVPGIVEALASRDEEVREHALYEGLWSALYHQGSLYSSTVFAIPLLVALLKRPGLSCRIDILRFLLECLERGQRSVSGVYRFVPGLPVLGKYFPTVEQQVASGHAVYAELAQSNEEEVAKFARALEARSRATIVRNS